MIGFELPGAASRGRRHVGHAVCFDAPGRRNDLPIDCGSTNSVQLLTKSFLGAQGVDRLSGLILTHGNSQHIGGAQTLGGKIPAASCYLYSFPPPSLEKDRFQIMRFFEGGRVVRRVAGGL